jgi:hypothetical protein
LAKQPLVFGAVLAAASDEDLARNLGFFMLA